MLNCTYLQTKIKAAALVLFSCFSCEIAEENSVELPYSEIDFSFSTAGHVYGEMGDTTLGVHQLLKDKREIKSNDFLILLGDAVYKSTFKEWRQTICDLNVISDSLVFATGNHEYSNKATFLEITRRKMSYFSFNHKGDVFFILDSELSPNGITGDQLNWLKSELNKLDNKGNVFICLHKLIWWNEHSVFKELTPNSVWNTDHMTLNFWTELEPVLNALSKEVYIIAGDMAGSLKNDGYMYYAYENIHLVGTGMGASRESNYLTFNVHKNKEVSIELHSLLSDSVFNLKSFIMPFARQKKQWLKQF